jgi:RNA recognition motif-containing protein
MANSSNAAVTQSQINKGKVLNTISLNTSRERMSELFNDFKQMNTTDHSAIGQNSGFAAESPSRSNYKTSIESKSFRTTTEGSQGNDSIELIKVTMAKPNKSSALYVGDIDLKVTEEVLYNFFKKYPSLSSVKICYEPGTKKSLGYGYINFDDEADARLALDELNYTKLMGKEIRIMESLQGKNKQFSGTNVFISKLNMKGLSLRSFHEQFKSYGTILSCKLDQQKKQGFISFESKSVAEDFVKKINNTMLNGSKVFCAIHIPKRLRDDGYRISSKTLTAEHDGQNLKESDSTLETVVYKSEAFEHSPMTASLPVDTNLSYSIPSIPASSSSIRYSEPFKEIYVKGLPVDCSETEVLKLFSCCGKIVEIFLENVAQFKSSWCLVNFEATESAINAVETYHKTLYKGRRLTCVKALKKVDRQIQLYHNSKNSHFSSFKPDASKSLEKVSSTYKLYLYNLPEGLNENFFKLFLRNYTFRGRILRYSIKSSNNFKDYSFIEFENETDSKEVNAKLNGINICGYTLVSALEKKKIGSDLPSNLKRVPSVLIRDGGYVSQLPTSIPHSSHPLNVGRINSDYLVPKFSNYSTVGLSPNAFGYNSSCQTPQFGPPGVNNRTQGVRINSVALSRAPSIQGEYFKQKNHSSSVSTIDRLEEYASQNINFLVYPVATRPKNVKRIVQYIIDTCWGNDVDKIRDVLKCIECDPLAENAFKQKIVETIKLFGFER